MVVAPAIIALPNSRQFHKIERTADAMGATFSITFYADDDAKMDAAAEGAFAEARRLDELLSNYKPGSEWSRVNRDAANAPVRISQELFELLSHCVAYSRQSDGAFDITVGPLMRVWGFYRDEGRLADASELKRALSGVGYRHVHLDPVARTVFFDQREVELDPGGVGKGYAVDRMVEVLRQRGVETALVSASGSSIYGMGAPPDQPEGWPIQITDPRNATKIAGTAFLKDASLSTSGAYEKFFEAGGKRYSHIMDPRTGEPAPGTLSVSVVAPKTLDSEVWAKPYFINGRGWTERHKPKEFRVFFCEDKPSQPCAWLR